MKDLLRSFGRVLFFMALLCPLASRAQTSSVSGTIAAEAAAKPSTASTTVVWLTPQSGAEGAPLEPMHAVLTQKNKAFEPHLLVVTRGSTVDFPNRDPWFHNVFSLFDGKRFDLGLYEAGSSRTVHFDRDGISFIFCNIHPEMSAIVVVLGTPYYATTNARGEFAIAAVPPGRYTLHVWNENVLPAALQALSREVTVEDSPRSLGVLRLPITKSALLAHKNKYGQPYQPPSPSNPVYAQP